MRENQSFEKRSQNLAIKDKQLLYNLAIKYSHDEKILDDIEYEIYKRLDDKHKFRLQDEQYGV